MVSLMNFIGPDDETGSEGPRRSLLSQLMTSESDSLLLVSHKPPTGRPNSAVKEKRVPDSILHPSSPPLFQGSRSLSCDRHSFHQRSPPPSLCFRGDEDSYLNSMWNPHCQRQSPSPSIFLEQPRGVHCAHCSSAPICCLRPQSCHQDTYLPWRSSLLSLDCRPLSCSACMHPYHSRSWGFPSHHESLDRLHRLSSPTLHPDPLPTPGLSHHQLTIRPTQVICSNGLLQTQ